jgi:RNA polymerase sigma-70 factor (ECF subfamily)
MSCHPTVAVSVEQEGRTPVFEEIYEAYAERVLNVAYRMTGNEETARDLTQEIFIKVYEHLESFQHRSQVFTWLYRIAVNHVTNYLRKERRRRWVSLMDWKLSDALREDEAAGARDIPADQLSADGKMESDERARLVWSAIQSLPVKYRVPIVLFHYDGMSYKEIAATLAISLSAVETRIHRAKKKLAKALEPWLDRI